jgi:hypothetical protein
MLPIGLSSPPSSSAAAHSQAIRGGDANKSGKGDNDNDEDENEDEDEGKDELSFTVRCPAVTQLVFIERPASFVSGFHAPEQVSSSSDLSSSSLSSSAPSNASASAPASASSASSLLLLALCDDGALLVYEARSLQLLHSLLNAAIDAVVAAVVNNRPSSHSAASSLSSDHSPSAACASSLSTASDATRLLVCDAQGEVRIWDTTDLCARAPARLFCAARFRPFEQPHHHHHQHSRITSAAFCSGAGADGLFAIGGEGGRVVLCSLDGEPVAALASPLPWPAWLATRAATTETDDDDFRNAARSLPAAPGTAGIANGAGADDAFFLTAVDHALSNPPSQVARVATRAHSASAHRATATHPFSPPSSASPSSSSSSVSSPSVAVVRAMAAAGVVGVAARFFQDLFPASRPRTLAGESPAGRGATATASPSVSANANANASSAGDASYQSLHAAYAQVDARRRAFERREVANAVRLL